MDANVGNIYDRVAASPYFRFLLNTHGGRDSEDGDKWWGDIQDQFNAATDQDSLMKSALGDLVRTAELSNQIAKELNTREIPAVMAEVFKRAGKTAANEDVSDLWDGGSV